MDGLVKDVLDDFAISESLYIRSIGFWVASYNTPSHYAHYIGSSGISNRDPSDRGPSRGFLHIRDLC